MPDPVLSAILRINRQRRRDLRQTLAPYRYAGGMHLIALYVDRNPGASQEEIASHYGADKTGVARDARKLEEMGHIRREINPENRRQYRLFLTEEGEKMIPVIHQAWDDFAAKLSAGIPEEEWQQLQYLLKRLEDNCMP